MSCLEAEERKHSLPEIEFGISEDTVRKEAEKCLACGLPLLLVKYSKMKLRRIYAGTAETFRLLTITKRRKGF